MFLYYVAGIQTRRGNLLVSLARILILNWLYMNELDYLEINSLDYDYNELNSNWLELDHII